VPWLRNVVRDDDNDVDYLFNGFPIYSGCMIVDCELRVSGTSFDWRKEKEKKGKLMYWNRWLRKRKEMLMMMMMRNPGSLIKKMETMNVKDERKEEGNGGREMEGGRKKEGAVVVDGLGSQQ
jgi:hypothetical protein